MNAVAAYLVTIHLEELHAAAARERLAPRTSRPGMVRRLLAATASTLRSARTAVTPARA